MIVGAGTAGLLLANLLERACISYQLFEKTKELKPLGAAIALTSLSHIFEQLDMYDEIIAASKNFGALHLVDEDLQHRNTFDARLPGVDVKELYGDYTQVIARFDLIRILLSRIPPHKILYNKRVLMTKHEDDEVVIHCHDNTTYGGTILVGTDGAYSSVRQNMYKEMSALGILPKVDAKPLGYDFDCLVGVTRPLDPEKYPVLKEEFCEFQIILGNDIPFSWWFIPLANNRIGWQVSEDVRKNGTATDRNFAFSAWDPDSAKNMCDKVRHLSCPYGGTLGDILDETPQEVISKVMLEDKYFTTWYYKRTVLLGDACHKMLSFGGQGATMGIQSAVLLANLLFDIENTSEKEVTRVFKEYYDARSGPGKVAVKSSHETGTLIHMRGPAGKLLRHVGFNWTPKWAMKKSMDAYNKHKVQVSYLPFVKMRGTYISQLNAPSRRMIEGSNIPMAI
ncbi:hypothetical protein BGZ95_004481 [Linnemannia exigua]|uniref:FAD-binding domain-containing protein n=1 Tax=Linnemannia exigua TaxID=604196 RepID=A0AAD4DHB6_9FUNG|nr:hypothetical protein BGZ95_004481 [Linnemannia exigua]